MRKIVCALWLGVAAAAPATAQGPALYPHEKTNNWGRWGADDERGAANFITPDAIVAAAKLIQSGKTFSLAIPIDANGPVFPPRRVPHHTMEITGADFHADPSLEPFGPTPLRFADDYIYMPLQGSSQWDGLSHAWYGEKLYNGIPESAIRSGAAGGATKLGIENVKTSFVGRAVLIDVLRAKGGTLPEGYGITRKDLESALAKQGAEVRRGDVVPWIEKHEISAVAADNMALEQLPNEIDEEIFIPLHGNLLRDLGVYIGEIWWLEELAEDCAKDGRYEFFLAAQPLHIPGAVGSPVNPIAIK